MNNVHLQNNLRGAYNISDSYTGIYLDLELDLELDLDIQMDQIDNLDMQTRCTTREAGSSEHAPSRSRPHERMKPAVDGHPAIHT
jgi:hypothetical protein